MGSCTRRHFLLSICILQLVSTVERQVFDFLGYMWAPILANFFHIIFVIFGFFGAYQYRPKYIITYTIWNLLWMAWNSFIICFYLSVGVLDKDSDILNLGLGSVSWWEVNGWGCHPVYSTNITNEDPYSPFRPTSVSGCLLDYTHVEIIHAALQCLLAILAVIGGICLSRVFLEEDDSSRTNVSTKRSSLYSIELSPQHEIRSPDNDCIEYESSVRIPVPLSPKPMTPRRVKRRSVMTRGSSGRQSSSRSHHHHRSSVRSSRRKSQNPVTRLIEQQQKGIPSFTHIENPGLNVNNLNTHTQNTNVMPHLSSLSHDPNPIYYNTTDTNILNPQPPWQIQGHSNPTYQQSSNHSLNESEDFEELYNNRPASARSSYSNFHGTRPISYSGDNYFANNFTQTQATPQVPQKRTSNPNRQSLRSVAFLNNGPPAYNFQGHTPPDSETPM